MAAVLFRLRCRLRSGWRTTALLAGVVGVTGAIVVTLVAGAVRTVTAPDRYSASRGGQLGTGLEQSHGRPRTAELSTLPAVAGIESATFVFGGLLAPDGRDIGFAAVFSGSPTAITAALVDGREADPATPGEFVASTSFAQLSGAKLGDQFHLVTITQEQADERGFDVAEPAGPTLTATLVGLVDQGPLDLDDPTPLVVFSPALLDVGAIGVSATVSVVTLAPDATVADLRAQLDALPDGAAFSIGPADWVPSEVRAAVSAQGQGLAIVATIAGITTIVVVGQLLTRQVRLSTDERLVLHAMGMTSRQVVADPLVRAAVPAALGSGIAVVGAYLASDLFPTGFVRGVEPHPGLRFEARVHLPAAAGLGVLVLAWVLVALAARERRRPIQPTGRGLVDFIACRLPAQPATALRFAFSRGARDAVGPRGPVAGMVGVLAVLVGALTFGASLRQMVDHPSYWGYNFDLALGSGGGDLSDDVRALLTSDPDVSAAALVGAVTVTVGTEQFRVVGMQALRDAIDPVVLGGRLPIGTGEIALGRVDAHHFGLDIGDDLTVVGPAGRRTLRITGLIVVPPAEGADGVGQDGLVTFDALREIDASAARSVAVMRLRPGADRDAVAARISTATGLAVGPFFDQPSAVRNVARIRGIPYLLAATLAILGLLSLGHQVLVSAHRRRRDVAVLRALGADGRWITGVVHWQATLFTLVVLAVGAPVGLVAGRLVYRAFVDRIGARTTVSLPLLAVVAAVVVLVVLANVVAAPGSRHARQRPPARMLAGE